MKLMGSFGHIAQIDKNVSLNVAISAHCAIEMHNVPHGD